MQEQKSKYIQIIELNDSYCLIYHSLLGNLVKVSKPVVTLLDNLDTMDEAYKTGTERVAKTLEYLRSKQFIVKKDEDEKAWIKKELKERPEKLRKGALVGNIQLAVSNQCNMQCKYCFEKRQDHVKVREYGTKMSFDVAKDAIEKIIKNAVNNDRKEIKINFFGGEPLTNKELIKQVLHYFGDGSKYGVQLYYSIDTNGILVDEEIADIFREYRVLVNLSIDYIGKGEQYRADGGAGALFSQFDKSVKILQNKGVTMYFLTVLSSITFEHFHTSLLDYAKEHGVVGNDVILSFDLDFEHKHSAKEVIEKVVDYFEYGNNLDIFVGGYWGDMIDQLERRSNRTYEGFKSCPGIGNRLSIEPNGDVFACKSSCKIYGNIKDFDQVLQSTQYMEYGMRAYQNAKSCEGCNIEGVCAGACLGTLENKYNEITTMDPYLCSIYKNLIPEILKVKYKN